MNCVKIFVILFISCINYVNSDPSHDWNSYQRLRKKLLKDYDTMVIPHPGDSIPSVNVEMNLKQFWIEDDLQMLVIDCWLVLSWTDDRLKYDKKDYDNWESVKFGHDELWKPDVAVYNNAKMSTIDHYAKTHSIVYPTGEVFSVPPAHFEVNCPLDLYLWPFDIQSCIIYFGSWSTIGDELMLSTNNKTEIYTDEVFPHDWILLSTNKEITNELYGNISYITLVYNFTMQRFSPTLEILVIVPAIVIPLILLTQYLLPVDNSKRLAICATCTIMTFMQLLFLKYSLPKHGTGAPLVVRCYSELFILVVITLAANAVFERLTHPQHPLIACAPPEIILNFLKGIPSTVLCLRSYADKIGLIEKEEEEEESKVSNNFTLEWLFIAKIGDNLMLIIILVVYVISFFSFFGPTFF